MKYLKLYEKFRLIQESLGVQGKNLSELILDSNKLKGLPSSITKIKSLKKLDLKRVDRQVRVNCIPVVLFQPIISNISPILLIL